MPPLGRSPVSGGRGQGWDEGNEECGASFPSLFIPLRCKGKGQGNSGAHADQVCIMSATSVICSAQAEGVPIPSRRVSYLDEWGGDDLGLDASICIVLEPFAQPLLPPAGRHPSAVIYTRPILFSFPLPQPP